MHREPVDRVELFLGHVLPAKFVPLAELVAKVSNDDQLGFRTILASLALRELDANNIDGAAMATNALDENLKHVRTLAEKRVNYVTTMTENLEPGIATNIEKGEATAAEVWTQYDRLIRLGTDSRDIAEKIVPRLKNKCSARHVRRILRRGRTNAE